METADSGLVRLTGKAPSNVDPNYVRSANPIAYDDAEGKGMRFEAAVQAIADGGTMRTTPAALRIEGARSVTLFVAAATGFRGFDQAPSRSAQEIAADCRAAFAREDLASAFSTRRLLDWADLMLRSGDPERAAGPAIYAKVSAEDAALIRSIIRHHIAFDE